MTTDNPTPDTLDHLTPEVRALVEQALADQQAANAAHAAQHLAHLEADAFGSAEIPEGRHAAPVCPMPPSEILMSLNGFDEIAIASHYGQKIGDMREADVITTGRALAFVWFRRQGQRDKEAHESSMALTMRQVVEFFAPEVKPDAEGNAESASPTP